jgi:hypothetical protein
VRKQALSLFSIRTFIVRKSSGYRQPAAKKDELADSRIHKPRMRHLQPHDRALNNADSAVRSMSLASICANMSHGGLFKKRRRCEARENIIHPW